ncbi:MAG: tRNA pseudouridine(38-40) synthase TruA [Lachnospiraceae bacterium]|jgi:tRNA pseudouridine synthase A|nr:tRNA pseudouridine(38-40) synthase TruA [Lachnoclostridium sp.]MDD7522027.1 tRNA pseudouridine(38-40) synthase TruA [Lachnoclostridium sp.]MDY2599397.1 tRNA pseudouridine(38-40) synthase TruA [Lachnospiraceae bacterium]
MKRVMLIVAYDGTNYHGWQMQPNAVTIEQILNEKLSELLKEDIQVIGASRTDAGVHAEGNVAVFDTNTSIPGEKISYALNHLLPEDIVIQESFEVEPDFHPRKCDSIKTYQYRILNRNFNLPVKGRNAYHFYRKLDLDKMREAAAYFVGKHDFKNFCSSHTQAKSTIRIIYSFDIEEEDEEIVLTVSGNGFLYNMVRMLTGTLLDVGTGRMSPDKIPELLAAKERVHSPNTAPARGLTLLDIEYL